MKKFGKSNTLIFVAHPHCKAESFYVHWVGGRYFVHEDVQFIEVGYDLSLGNDGEVLMMFHALLSFLPLGFQLTVTSPFPTICQRADISTLIRLSWICVEVPRASFSDWL